ncbi:MAG TPA: hypothetical protein VN634_17945 [Candidatus Limnocylindrales bacterium]|nr:hypothetical protein [Candidatus Limnocylindrales bacterium]
MKRVLQGLALLQLLLVIGIGARMVQVWSTPLPEFGEIPELPAPAPLPPPKPVAKISDATTEAVVEHDLFDDQRGQGKTEEVAGGVEIEAAPVPPPSNVQLMGVMAVGQEPVAILLDTSVNPEQKSVRKGDMFGEYQVGDIASSGLTLLGTGGQQFQIPLKVGAASGGVPGAGPHVPPPPPGGAATRPVPGAKPVTARPVPPQRPDQPPDAGEQKAMSARERAQAIAQRNAELRKNKGGGGAAGNPDKEGGKPDPVQARLEALRQLREAAKSR